MSAALDASQRLRRLEQILEGPRTSAVSPGEPREASTTRLERASIERIRRITAELQDRGDSTSDDIDALAARLLLNDYAAAVAHLRAAARDAARSIDAAEDPIKGVRRFLWRDDKHRQGRQPAVDDQTD